MFLFSTGSVIFFKTVSSEAAEPSESLLLEVAEQQARMALREQPGPNGTAFPAERHQTDEDAQQDEEVNARASQTRHV